MPKVFRSKSQTKGKIGEDIACRYISDRGYCLIERNYTVPHGEIDIVAEKGNILVFFEVKSAVISPSHMDFLIHSSKNVPHETKSIDVTHVTNDENYENTPKSESNLKGHEICIRPEDNMHSNKLHKLYRTIEIYLSDKDVLNKKEWCIDLLCVFIDIHTKRTKVIHYENVNIE